MLTFPPIRKRRIGDVEACAEKVVQTWAQTPRRDAHRVLAITAQAPEPEIVGGAGVAGET